MIRFKHGLRLLICMMLAVQLLAEHTARSVDESKNSINDERSLIGSISDSTGSDTLVDVEADASATEIPRGVHADLNSDEQRMGNQYAGTSFVPSRGGNMKEEEDGVPSVTHTPDTKLDVDLKVGLAAIKEEVISAILAELHATPGIVKSGPTRVADGPSSQDDVPRSDGDDTAGDAKGTRPSPTCVGDQCDNGGQRDDTADDFPTLDDDSDNSEFVNDSKTGRTQTYFVYDDDVDMEGLDPSMKICDEVCARRALTYSGVRTRYALNECDCASRTLVKDFSVRMERIVQLNEKTIASRSAEGTRAKGVLMEEPKDAFDLLTALVGDDLDVGLYVLEALMAIVIYYHTEWYMPFLGLTVSIFFLIAAQRELGNHAWTLLCHFITLCVYNMALSGAKAVQDVTAALFVVINCVLAVVITGLVLYKDSLYALTFAVIVNIVCLTFTAISMVTSKSINAGSVCFMALVMGRSMPIMSNQMVGCISAIGTISEAGDCLQFFLTQLALSAFGGRRQHWMTYLDVNEELADLRKAVPQSLWMWWTANSRTNERFDWQVMNMYMILEMSIWSLRFAGIFAFRLISTKGKWVCMTNRPDIPKHKCQGTARLLYEIRGVFLTIACPELPSALGDMYGLIYAVIYLTYMSALVDVIILSVIVIVLCSLIIMVHASWLFDCDMVYITKKKKTKVKKKGTLTTTTVVQECNMDDSDDAEKAMVVIPQIDKGDLVSRIESAFAGHASGGSVTPMEDLTRLNASDVAIRTAFGKCHAFKAGARVLMTVAHAFVEGNIEQLDDRSLDEFSIDIEGHKATPCMVEISHENTGGTDALIRMTFDEPCFKPVKGGFLPIHGVGAGDSYFSWIMSRDGKFGQDTANTLNLTGYGVEVPYYNFLTIKSDSGRPLGGLVVPHGMAACGLHLGHCPDVGRNVSIPLAGGTWRTLCGEPTSIVPATRRSALGNLMAAASALTPTNPLHIPQVEAIREYFQAEIQKSIEAEQKAKDPKKPVAIVKKKKKKLVKVAVKTPVATTVIAAASSVDSAVGKTVVAQMLSLVEPEMTPEVLNARKVWRTFTNETKKVRKRVRQYYASNPRDPAQADKVVSES